MTLFIAGTRQKNNYDPYLVASPYFFTSGRNFTYAGGKITGLLKKLDGTEIIDSIDLNNYIGVEIMDPDNSKLKWKSSGYEEYCKSCILINNFSTLSCRCKRNSAKYKDTTISLISFKNVDGKFEYQPPVYEFGSMDLKSLPLLNVVKLDSNPLPR